MNLRKILASILCLAMVLSAMSVSVFASGDSNETDAVAMFNGEYYSTVALALADATASTDEEVEITVLKNVTSLPAPTRAGLTFAAADGVKVTSRVNPPGSTKVDGIVKYVGFDFSTYDTSNGCFACFDGNHELEGLEVVFDDCLFGGERSIGIWGLATASAMESLTVNDCKIVDGGGMYFNLGKVNNIYFTDCDFSNYTAGKAIIQLPEYAGNVTVTNCDFGNGFINYAPNLGEFKRSLTVTESTFDGTKAINVHSNFTNSTIEWDEVTVTENVMGDTTPVFAFPAGVDAEEYIEANATTFNFTDNVTTGGEEVTDLTVPVNGVAMVNGTYYATLQEALKAITAENNVVEIVSDITIDYAWDLRYTGSKITVPVTINGNGHTLTFTGEVNDGYNHLAVFRFEDVATVKNLTIDASAATSIQRGISAKLGGTVENCTFIGNYDGTNGSARFAYIFGEGAGSAISDVEVSVSGCTFEDWRYGVADNCNGQDVKSVTVTENDFDNAKALISASDSIVFTNNVVEDGYVEINSFTAAETVAVTATGNTLEGAKDKIAVNPANVTADDAFATAVAKIGTKYYASLGEAVDAAVDGDIVYVVPGTVHTDELVINKSITITGNPDYGTSTSVIEKPIIKISETTNGGVEYHAPNVTFDNLVFEVAEGATGSGWNCSALGFYYEIVADRNGLAVTNCDFINNSDLAIGAIAANMGKYTVENNTFKNFSIGVWSYCDHLAADEIVISNNTFENVPSLVSVYHGNPADGSANITVSNNKATDGSTTQISVTDYGQVKATPATAYDNVVITNNDANIMLGNYAEDSFNDTIEDNVAVIYNYASEAILKALESAGIPDGEVYVNYGSDSEVKYLVTDGNVYAAANTIEVEFEDVTAADAEGEKIYNINLKANADGIINRLNSADLTFVMTQDKGENEYEIIASNSEIAINPVDNSKVRYEFHFDGKDDVLTDTDTVITIGQVKFTGYGTFDFAVDTTVDTNAVHATTMIDNIVDTFIPNGSASGEGELDVSDNTITDIVIAVPSRELTINVDFNNAVDKNAADYQDMTLTVSGGDLDKAIVVELGDANQNVALTYDEKATAKYTVNVADGYTIVLTDVLAVDNSYTVTIEGAGYRTARYTVTMTCDKTVNFWNNVMDNDVYVEESTQGNKAPAKVTFLAGDIVKDNKINIYDLSAVVSYFGTENLVADHPTYAKYDLNRDGVIDSKDVAYVLVSWGK